MKATNIEQGIGLACGKSPFMIRFYAMRMLLELRLGRALKEVETKRLSSCVRYTFGQKHPVKFHINYEDFKLGQSWAGFLDGNDKLWWESEPVLEVKE